jgi:hypothetical protein
MQDETGAFSEVQLARLSASTARVHASYAKLLKQLQRFISSPAGYPFHRTVERQGRMVLPNSVLLESSVSAITCLVINSLREDEYGVVQKSIKDIMKSLYDLELALNEYIKSPQRHWSDPQEPSGAALAPIRLVKDLVTDAIDRISADFAAYLPTLHLAEKVLERARQAVTEPDEDISMTDTQLEMQEIAAGYRESPLLRFANKREISESQNGVCKSR